MKNLRVLLVDDEIMIREGFKRLFDHDCEAVGEASDGMEALELVLAIYKSAAEGRPVKLPLEDCSTLDFAGRFGLTD